MTSARLRLQSKNELQNPKQFDQLDCRQNQRNLLPLQQSLDTSDYEFVIKNIGNPDCSIEQILVSFKPITDSLNGKIKKTTPIYNNDRRHWSPAFVIQDDPFEQQQEELKFRNKYNHFLKQIMTGSNQQKQLCLPDKNGDSIICGVCARKIRKYKKHIDKNSHKYKIKCSLGQKYIRQLIKTRYADNQLDDHEQIDSDKSSDSATALKSKYKINVFNKNGKQQKFNKKRLKKKQQYQVSLEQSCVYSWEIEHSW